MSLKPCRMISCVVKSLAPLVVLQMAFQSSVYCQSPDSSACKLTQADRAGIKKVIEDYRTAWLAGNDAGVRRTLSDDAVLLPAQGAKPVVGMKAIQGYWWPADSKPTTIDKLDITVAEIGGDCRVAFARGTDFVAWTVKEAGGSTTYSHPSTYLNVMKKTRDGSWRIWQHMWDDSAQTTRKNK